jgi:hypothetical protein
LTIDSTGVDEFVLRLESITRWVGSIQPLGSDPGVTALVLTTFRAVIREMPCPDPQPPCELLTMALATTPLEVVHGGRRCAQVAI